jgi:uracil-DNA glycosylase
MDLNTVFSDYWELLSLSEDYLKGGYRSDHDPAPSFRFAIPRSSEESPEAKPKASISTAEEGSLEERILNCRRCDLHLARKQAIPGQGGMNPRLVVVLPPPGYDEDEANTPISGEGADFLNKWLGAVGLTENQVYLTNSVKCRAPGTRPPFPAERDCCGVFLEEQIDLLKPEAVLLLGEEALAMVDRDGNLEGRRGTPFFQNNRFYLVTYDPLQVLQDGNLKRPAWEDLKILRDFLHHE